MAEPLPGNMWIINLLGGAFGLFSAGALCVLLSVLIQRVRHGVATARLGPIATVSLSCAWLGSITAFTAAGSYGRTYCDGWGTELTCQSIQQTLWAGPQLVALSHIDQDQLWQQNPLALVIHLDALTMFFIALISFATCAIAIYSYGWLAGDLQQRSVAGGFNLFAAAMLLLPLMDNVFWLLLALEVVSLSSAYLVLYRGRRDGLFAQNRTALRIYLIVSHASTVCLLAALLILAVHYQSFSFAMFRRMRPDLAPTHWIATIVFLLTLIGLSLRAGITPFHAWVPIVHPQLPTNMHAMVSAIMLKLPVYVMIRVFLEYMQPVWWWGVLILLLASATALISVFLAVLSRDLKEALAYHSVENLGIILFGLGLAVLFAGLAMTTETAPPPGLRGAAGLALVASLFHTMNHGLFKTLLFLGVGSIENRTATSDIGRLGGLIRLYPWTSITFLIGAVAIAGFPPLNGFISEWLTLQALFAGWVLYGQHESVVAIILLVLLLSLIMLAASFAMTAVAFVKIAGETILGHPRDTKLLDTARRGEAAWSMRTSMALLALLCLGIGLAPWVIMPIFTAVSAGVGYPVGGQGLVLDVQYLAITIRAAEYTTSLPILMVVMLVIFPLLSFIISIALHNRRPPETTGVWIGGEQYDPQTMQYTGSALSSLLWSWAVRRDPLRSASLPLPARVLISSERYIREPLNHLYNVLLQALGHASNHIGERLQNGDIRLYLLYVLTAFICALMLLVATS